MRFILMNIKTIIIDYEPLKLETLKGAQLKRHQYFQDTLAKFNLGELYFLSLEDAKKQICDINPLLVFALSDFTAREIKNTKSDNLIYVIDAPYQIFHRKVDIEKKQEKLHRILSEASGLLQTVLNGEKKEKDLRYFASLSYTDMYEMFKKALIGDNENLKKVAWDTLFGEGERHSNIIWMRAQFMVEIWKGSDWKGREKLMCMSMERHIDNGTARKMDNFVDSDGQEYYQYMFIDPYGNDLNHIRRLPFATKEQERFAYESLLEKNEIPANYMRIQIEANQLREQYDEYLQTEHDKIWAVLDKWEKDPKLSRKELGVVATEDGGDNDPLSNREIEILRGMLNETMIKQYEKNKK